MCACRYAKSERLRSLVNLVVVGGVIDPEDTGDREERAECEKMHGLVEKYNLKVGRFVEHGCDLRV
jgi:sucrose synthase